MKQAGAELGQAQARFELLMKFKLTLYLEFTISPDGGWWVGAGSLDEVEVEAELGNTVNIIENRATL